MGDWTAEALNGGQKSQLLVTVMTIMMITMICHGKKRTKKFLPK
jgi:hypothetical protein